MSKRKFKKGSFYLTWMEPINPGTGLPTGRIAASKRSPTSNKFSITIFIPKNTRVMFVAKAKHGFVRVLYNETLVQIGEGFLINDPEFTK